MGMTWKPGCVEQVTPAQFRLPGTLGLALSRCRRRGKAGPQGGPGPGCGIASRLVAYQLATRGTCAWLGARGRRGSFGEADSSLWFRASSVSWLESQAPSGQEMTPGHTADAGRLPSRPSPLRRRHGDPTRQGPSKRPRPSGREAPCPTSQGAAVRRGPGPFPGPCCPEAALSEGPARQRTLACFSLETPGGKYSFSGSF